MLSAVFILWTLRLRHIPRPQPWYYIVLAATFLVDNSCAFMAMRGIANTWLYNMYLPVQFALLAVFAQRIRPGIWPLALCIGAIMVYATLLWSESRGSVNAETLFSRSLLFAWGYLTVIFTWSLVLLADRTEGMLWRDQRFWLYLSIVVFFGVALPFVGSINKVNATNPGLADRLFYIVDALYFLSYAMVGVAGWLLGPPSLERT